MINCSKRGYLSICIGYHMSGSGEVISVLSLEGRYYNCHERAQRARDNYDIVTRVIQLISPSQSCDNLYIYSSVNTFRQVVSTNMAAMASRFDCWPTEMRYLSLLISVGRANSVLAG